MKLMIMAGTTEAVEIIKRMNVFDGLKIVATTTTSQGAELAKSAGAQEVISRPLDGTGIEELIKAKEIDVLVDATHPFAQEATRNAIIAADATGIKYIRFERPTLEIPENDLLHQVNSFEDAVIKVLELVKEDDRILHLAGVMTLLYLTKRIDSQRIVARVLPSVYSLEKCFEMGLPAENIIAMQGTFSKEFNKTFMEEFDISVMVTKESGEAGGTPSKIEAALELGIPVVMVVRPFVLELENKLVLNYVNDVFQEIKKLIKM